MDDSKIFFATIFLIWWGLAVLHSHNMELNYNLRIKEEVLEKLSKEGLNGGYEYNRVNANRHPNSPGSRLFCIASITIVFILIAFYKFDFQGSFILNLLQLIVSFILQLLCLKMFSKTRSMRLLQLPKPFWISISNFIRIGYTPENSGKYIFIYLVSTHGIVLSRLIFNNMRT
jgi:hypothetical protein